MRRAAIPVLAAILLTTSAASAQEPAGFARGDRAVVTIDNLAGIVHQRSSVEGNDDDLKVTHVGSLATLTLPGSPPLTRLGFHYFVTPTVSLGSGFHYSDTGNLGESLVLAPRVGVAFPMGESTALWLRAGLTYARQKMSFFTEITYTNIMPGADALFVISPVEHFAFTLGATAEVGVAGSIKTKAMDFGSGATVAETSTDMKSTAFGLVFGALASF